MSKLDAEQAERDALTIGIATLIIRALPHAIEDMTPVEVMDLVSRACALLAVEVIDSEEYDEVPKAILDIADDAQALIRERLSILRGRN